MEDPLQKLEALAARASRAMEKFRRPSRSQIGGQAPPNHAPAAESRSDHPSVSTSKNPYPISSRLLQTLRGAETSIGATGAAWSDTLTPRSRRADIISKAQPTNLVEEHVHKLKSKNQAIISASSRRRREALQALNRVKASTAAKSQPTDIVPETESLTASNERERQREARARRDREKREKRRAARQALLDQLHSKSADMAPETTTSDRATGAANAPSTDRDAQQSAATATTQSALIVRDIVNNQFEKWTEHRMAEQRRLEQQEKMGKLKLELDKMKQEREMKARHVLMEKQLHEWMRTQKQRLVVERADAAVNAAEKAATAPRHPEQWPPARPGAVAVAQSQGMATADAVQRASELEKENLSLQQQKKLMIEVLERERHLFLEKQKAALQEQRAGQLAVKKSEELVHELQNHFQHELLRTRSINDMRVKAVVADGNSNADLWAQQLKVVQDQLVDAHKQNAHALSETQQVWSKERHNFIAEAHKQRNDLEAQLREYDKRLLQQQKEFANEAAEDRSALIQTVKEHSSNVTQLLLQQRAKNRAGQSSLSAMREERLRAERELYQQCKSSWIDQDRDFEAKIAMQLRTEDPNPISQSLNNDVEPVFGLQPTLSGFAESAMSTIPSRPIVAKAGHHSHGNSRQSPRAHPSADDIAKTKHATDTRRPHKSPSVSDVLSPPTHEGLPASTPERIVPAMAEEKDDGRPDVISSASSQYTPKSQQESDSVDDLPKSSTPHAARESDQPTQVRPLSGGDSQSSSPSISTEKPVNLNFRRADKANNASHSRQPSDSIDSFASTNKTDDHVERVDTWNSSDDRIGNTEANPQRASVHDPSLSHAHQKQTSGVENIAEDSPHAVGSDLDPSEVNSDDENTGAEPDNGDQPSGNDNTSGDGSAADRKPRNSEREVSNEESAEDTEEKPHFGEMDGGSDDDSDDDFSSIDEVNATNRPASAKAALPASGTAVDEQEEPTPVGELSRTSEVSDGGIVGAMNGGSDDSSDDEFSSDHDSPKNQRATAATRTLPQQQPSVPKMPVAALRSMASFSDGDTPPTSPKRAADAPADDNFDDSFDIDDVSSFSSSEAEEEDATGGPQHTAEPSSSRPNEIQRFGGSLSSFSDDTPASSPQNKAGPRGFAGLPHEAPTDAAEKAGAEDSVSDAGAPQQATEAATDPPDADSTAHPKAASEEAAESVDYSDIESFDFSSEVLSD